MKTKKLNIGINAQLKESIIRAYWSDSKFSKVIDLLHEFQDFFPRGYHELEGVHESLEEMKIKLKEGVHPSQKRPYMMNLNLHFKVKEEIDKMLIS